LATDGRCNDLSALIVAAETGSAGSHERELAASAQTVDGIHCTGSPSAMRATSARQAVRNFVATERVLHRSIPDTRPVRC
jgi:hypothetical protein